MRLVKIVICIERDRKYSFVGRCLFEIIRF